MPSKTTCLHNLSTSFILKLPPPRCYLHVVYTSSDLNQCHLVPNSNATESLPPQHQNLPRSMSPSSEYLPVRVEQTELNCYYFWATPS